MSKQGKRTKAEARARRAAELRKEQERKEKRRQLITALSVILGIALIIGVGALVMKLTDDPTPTKLKGASPEYALALGNPDGTNQVVIYEDFLCPACGALEKLTKDDLQQAIDDESVYVEYRPFELLGSLGDYSARAANAFKVVLEESGPEVAKKFHDELFANQPPEQAPFPDDNWLVDLAVKAGADEGAVRPGIEGMEYRDWVDAATSEATGDIGVRGTPTVYINGKLVETTTLEETANKMIDAAR